MRAHALFADPHLRRDLDDRDAAVEIFDDPLFALEFRQPGGARVRRRSKGAAGGRLLDNLTCGVLSF